MYIRGIRSCVIAQNFVNLSMIGIYKITSPSGRVYIGQSINIPHRWREYRSLECKNQTKLYRSFLKYGCENHTFEIIAECEESHLNDLERYYQDLYNVLKEGLNCFLTKTTDKSGKMCETVKRKIGNAQKGEKNHNYGKKASEETKAKLSAIRKGRSLSPETIEKLIKVNTGRKRSDVTRKLQSELKKGCIPWNKGKNVMTDAQKEHLRQINLGKMARGKHNQARPVIDIISGEVFECAADVAEKLNVKSGTLRSWLNNKRPNNTNYRWKVS